MARKLKRGELSGKDMSVMREAPTTAIQHESERFELRDHSMEHSVVLYKDLNEDAERDLIFRLEIDGEINLFLDAEQVMRAARWV